MKIKIDNIEWDYSENRSFEDVLGYGSVGIPATMLKRFALECGWEETSSGLLVPPHFDPFEFTDNGGKNNPMIGNAQSIHECHNADTQIVLMNWLRDKRYSYKLDYNCPDAYWIFHDNQHSKHDVHGCEVLGITAWVEKQRLLEGLEMANKFGIGIKDKTLFDLINEFPKRFRSDEGLYSNDFMPLISTEQYDCLEMILEFDSLVDRSDVEYFKNEFEEN